MSVYYVTTAVITIIILALGWILWVKSRSLNFVFGAAALYFWSIHGAWGLIFDKSVGGDQLRYHYLETALFSVNIDEHYLTTLLYYGVFCVVVMVVALILVDGRRPSYSPLDTGRIHLNHTVVILFAIATGAVSYMVIADAFLDAIILGQTGYSAIRSESIKFFTIHQVLNRAALYSVLIGFSIFLSGSHSRFFRSRFNMFNLLSYLVVSIAMVAYMMVLGNKNELFTGFSFAVLFYVGTHIRKPALRTIGAALVMFMLVASIDYLRNFALLSGESQQVQVKELVDQTARIVFSNEAFAAHFSLYGAVKYDIEPSLGTGLNALAFSFVPISVWPDRPIGNYRYYADEVGAESGRGYTIHHATSWYLDFGLVGIVVGASILGAIWASLHNGFTRTTSGPFSVRRLFFIVSIFGFSAYLPVIIRGGIEIYKGVFVGAILIPMTFLLLATVLRRRYPVYG